MTGSPAVGLQPPEESGTLAPEILLWIPASSTEVSAVVGLQHVYTIGQGGPQLGDYG